MGLTTTTGASHSKTLMSVSKVVSQQVLLQQGMLAMWLWDTASELAAANACKGTGPVLSSVAFKAERMRDKPLLGMYITGCASCICTICEVRNAVQRR